MNKPLYSIGDASKLLGVSIETLRNWDKLRVLIPIKTVGGHRRYRQDDIDRFKGDKILNETNINEVSIYRRVSNQDQKKSGDLDRQQSRLLKYCMDNDLKVTYIFDEVCSGMRPVRPKLKKLFTLIEQRKINKVVVEYKDRLTRFMFDVFKRYFNSYGVEIILVERVLPKSFENELVEDMLSLLSSFSSRIYGKRSAERRKLKKVKNDKTNEA